MKSLRTDARCRATGFLLAIVAAATTACTLEGAQRDAELPQSVVAATTSVTSPSSSAPIANAGPEVLPVAEVRVSPAERDAEMARLVALGLSLPSGGLVLEKPFAAPYSRRSFVVPHAWLTAPLPETVPAAALRADLVALRAVMERAYGGWDRAAALGWDWDAWFRDWDASLAKRGSEAVPLREAFDPVRVLEDFQLDNHTTIPLRLSFGSGSATARLEHAPKAPCSAIRNADGKVYPLNAKDPAQLPKRARLFDGHALKEAHYLSFPASRGTVTAVQCNEWIGLKILGVAGDERAKSITELLGNPEDRPTMRHLSKDVAYLRLPTFSKSNGQIIERERKGWDKPTGKERALIVDLRGNDGGDAVLDAVWPWVSEEDLSAAMPMTKRTPKSCLYEALRWGYGNISSGNLKPPLTDGMRGRLQAAVETVFASDEASCKRQVEEVIGLPFPAKSRAARKGKPTILVLVDSGCGSDCEYMAQTLGKVPEAVLVGINTFGVLQFIQPGYAALPNTKLPFRIALGTSDIYGDGRSTDGYGVDVDVLLEGADAWSKDGLLRLALQLTGKKL